MKKRNFVIAGVGILILALVTKIVFFTAGPVADTMAPQDLTEAGAADQSADPITAAIDESEAHSIEMKEIKGKNFYVAYSVNTAPEPATVQFYNAAKDPITKYVTKTGEVSDIQNMTWGNDISAELSPPIKKLDDQELINLTFSDPLPRGEGFMSAQSLFIVENDSVREVLDVMVERTFDPEPDQQVKKINYKGALKCDWTKLSCDLKYNLNGKVDTITFNWDDGAKKFVDPSGRAKALDDELSH